MVNQASQSEICPEEHGDDGKFRPCRKGSLFGRHRSLVTGRWPPVPSHESPITSHFFTSH